MRLTLALVLVSFGVRAQLFDYKSNGPLQVHLRFNEGHLYEYTNNTKDTIRLSNVLPFTPSINYPFITGLGEHPLSRTHLFLPGRRPVNVIVPDNARDLGFNIRDNIWIITTRCVVA